MADGRELWAPAGIVRDEDALLGVHAVQAGAVVGVLRGGGERAIAAVVTRREMSRQGGGGIPPPRRKKTNPEK